MKIYKVSDFDGCSEDEAGQLKITDMKQGVKNENRVNVFVDGKYSFSLDVAQVVELGVKVGLIISEERLAELKRASEFGKLYQRALEWALARPRSRKEVKDYLMRKLKTSSSDTFRRARCYGGQGQKSAGGGISSDGMKSSTSNGISPENMKQLLVEVLDRLSSRGYVDDRKFAEFWVENRFVKKGVSTKRLQMELMKKGIDREVAEAVLAESERNEVDEIRKIIAKKRAKYDDEKLVAYLCRQGFSYDLAREQVFDYEKD